MKKSIRNIVAAVRMKFEKKVIPHSELEGLYSKYNPEVDCPSFIAEAGKLFLKLNCGLASVYLQKLLGGKVARGKYGMHSHTFLLLNSQVVDITADQYGGPKVYVGKLKPPWRVCASQH